MYNMLIAIIIGYLFGCLHGSQIVGKIKRIDIKNSGVKNAGASNTTIVLGWKYGIIVALIDILKGVFAILVFKMVMNILDWFYDPTLIFLVGVMVIIGHNYPFNMGFKGGKGTASVIGMLFAIDWKIALISVAILILVTLITDYLVIGVLFMYITFVVTTYFFDFGLNAVLSSLFLLFLSIYKHLENYNRIKMKTETKLSSMFKKKKAK